MNNEAVINYIAEKCDLPTLLAFRGVDRLRYKCINGLHWLTKIRSLIDPHTPQEDIDECVMFLMKHRPPVSLGVYYKWLETTSLKYVASFEKSNAHFPITHKVLLGAILKYGTEPHPERVDDEIMKERSEESHSEDTKKETTEEKNAARTSAPKAANVRINAGFVVNVPMLVNGMGVVVPAGAPIDITAADDEENAWTYPADAHPSQASSGSTDHYDCVRRLLALRCYRAREFEVAEWFIRKRPFEILSRTRQYRYRNAVITNLFSELLANYVIPLYGMQASTEIIQDTEFHCAIVGIPGVQLRGDPLFADWIVHLYKTYIGEKKIQIIDWIRLTNNSSMIYIANAGHIGIMRMIMNHDHIGQEEMHAKTFKDRFSKMISDKCDSATRSVVLGDYTVSTSHYSISEASMFAFKYTLRKSAVILPVMFLIAWGLDRVL